MDEKDEDHDHDNETLRQRLERVERESRVLWDLLAADAASRLEVYRRLFGSTNSR